MIKQEEIGTLNAGTSFLGGDGLVSMYQPKYSLPQGEYLAGEKLLFKLPILLRLDGKPERTTSDVLNPTLNLFGIEASELMFDPFSAALFDGILLVTNQRVVLRFKEQFVQYNREIVLRDLEAKLENYNDINTITVAKREKGEDLDSWTRDFLKADFEKMPYIELNDGLQFYPLTITSSKSDPYNDGVKYGSFSYFYILGNVSVYMGVLGLLRCVKEGKFELADVQFKKYFDLVFKHAKSPYTLKLLLTMALFFLPGAGYGLFLYLEGSDSAILPFVCGSVLAFLTFFASIASYIFQTMPSRPQDETALAIELTRDLKRV